MNRQRLKFGSASKPNKVMEHSIEAVIANPDQHTGLLGSRMRSRRSFQWGAGEAACRQNESLILTRDNDTTNHGNLFESSSSGKTALFTRPKNSPCIFSPLFKGSYPESFRKFPKSIEKQRKSSFKSRPSFPTKVMVSNRKPFSSRQLIKNTESNEQEIKRSLDFNEKTDEEDADYNEQPPECELTNITLRGSLLSKKTSARRISSIKEDDKENDPIYSVPCASRRPLISRRRSVFPMCDSFSQFEETKPKLQGRRSMIVLPTAKKSPGDTTEIPLVKVTHPSVDSDDFLFVKPSLPSKVKQSKTNISKRTSSSVQTESYSASSIKDCSTETKINNDNIQNEKKESSNVDVKSSKKFKDASTNTLVTGLHLTTKYNETEQVLMNAMKEQMQIIEKAGIMYQNLLSLNDQFVKSVQSVASLRQEFEANFSLKENEYVIEPTSLDCQKTGKYRFLGTPMAHKKNLRRSISEPEFSSPKSPESALSESFHSENSLSPFSNLVGDSDRPSLPPLTPRTKNYMFSLKTDVNEQFKLLCK